MLAAYGIDVLSPAVSTRRVHVLLERLPPHARRGGERWSVEAELLASLIDNVAMLTWVTMRANGAKNVAKPKPVTRPQRAALGGGRPAPGGPPARSTQDGPVKAATWMEAAMALVQVPGVRVVNDG